MSSKKVGVLTSYTNIALNMALSIFFTPFLLRSLGDAEYGIYKIMHSFAGQFSIMSFGLSVVVARNVVYYNVRNETDNKQNFLFIANIISFILTAAALLVGAVLYQFIDTLYGSTFSAEDLRTAKTLFVLLIANVSLTIFGDSFVGVIRGHEKFSLHYLSKTFKLIGRTVLIIVLLKLRFKSVAIAFSDLLFTVLALLFDILYSRLYLHEKAKFQFLDKVMLKTTLVFSVATLLRAIVNQVNQNMDSIILGAMVEPETVSMYSLALTIFVTYNSITNTVSAIFAPQATKMIYTGAENKKMTDFVIRPGRLQLALSGAVVGGFILFGNSFIDLWVGSSYKNVYAVVLILIIPAVIPVIVSVSNSILDAKLMQMGRSIILIIMSTVNVVSSIIMVHFWGYIGAAIGTALSYIVGYGIINNIYLHKKLDLEIKRMYLEICKGILPCILIASIILIPVALLVSRTLFGFVLKVIIYLVVYVLLLYKFGFNKNECKQYVEAPLRIIKRVLSKGLIVSSK